MPRQTALRTLPHRGRGAGDPAAHGRSAQTPSTASRFRDRCVAAQLRPGTDPVIGSVDGKLIYLSDLTRADQHAAGANAEAAV